MRQFTHEEIETLSQFEKHFKTATEYDYHRNLEPRLLLIIKRVYDEASGTEYRLSSSCGHCVLAFLKTVGKKYFADKQAYEEKAAQLVEALDEVFGEVPDEEPVSNEPEPKATKKAAPKKTTKKATTKKK